jgi:hypothetical protein
MVKLYKEKWNIIEITNIHYTGHYQFNEYHVYGVLQEEVQDSNVIYSGYWNGKMVLGMVMEN